ncbi:MAG: protein-disulfide reductase DsbD family protein [Ahrensia sp.]|nr:protein-disulfide reductase DsbD family protein [Ahrensia sp.]
MRYLIVLLTTVLLTTPAVAAVGEWFRGDGVKLRLVSLRDASNGTIRAGLHIVLEPGWKTYWRSPGSSGLPPQLDFSRSQNVAKADIAFPTPIAFGEGTGLTSGYSGEVVLPIAVETIFSDRNVVLSLQGLMGVCEDVCVPMQFTTELTDRVDGGSSLEAAQLLARAEASLPTPATDAVSVTSAKAKAGKLVVTATLPADANHVTLFLEGPVSWYLAPETPTRLENGSAEFSVTLPRGIQPDAARGEALRATLAVDGRGYEQAITVE